VGISYDDPEDNKGWSDLMGFEFPLLSDPDRKIGSLLDVRRPAAHPFSAFPRRVTYLIDPAGTITNAYDVGRKIEGHADQVLEDLREHATGE
jgi:peroxiredoxin Q/BCP